MCARRKYLRVCGEERASHCLRLAMWEIPPRVRRRDMAWILLPQRAGNTSACAEKSSTCLALPARIRKYLRVRSEERRVGKEDSDRRQGGAERTEEAESQVR